MIIPYAVARLSAANLPYAPRVDIDVAGAAPLRLGDGPYRRQLIEEEAFAVAQDDALPTGAARLEILRRLHLRDCDVFDKFLRRWLDLYFAFIAAEVRAAATELASQSPAGDALDPVLWALAALRPLPRAHISVGEDRFVAVDAALWDGSELIALLFAGTDHARSAPALAGHAHVVVAEPPDAHSAPTIIADQLGDRATHFWRGLAVPPDPFRPRPLRGGAAVRPAF